MDDEEEFSEIHGAFCEVFEERISSEQSPAYPRQTRKLCQY